jgi:hypothetical protein
MKSKLEEKKSEFMNELNKTLSCFMGGENHIEAPTYGDVCNKAFDAGISAYKEMLECDITKIKDALIFVNGYLGLINKTSVICDWRINDMRDKLEEMTKDIEVLK